MMNKLPVILICLGLLLVAGFFFLDNSPSPKEELYPMSHEVYGAVLVNAEGVPVASTTEELYYGG